MDNQLQLVQKVGMYSLDYAVVEMMKKGWALYGSPFSLVNSATQAMAKGPGGDPGEIGEYRVLSKSPMLSLEAQCTQLGLLGWELYGDPFHVSGVPHQAMVHGFVPIQHGAGYPSGSTPDTPGLRETGYFDYQNTVFPQKTVSAVWGTLVNTGAGPFTEKRFAPPGVTNMLDPATGRILLNELSIGDQVDIQYTLNALGYSNGVDISFRHLAGQEGQQYELALGTGLRLQSGAGVLTGVFAASGSFIVRDENTRLGGVLPQVKSAGVADITYTSAYIRVRRNSLA